MAAPVFREIATSALRMMDVPKDLPDSLIRASRGTADENDLAIAGLSEDANKSPLADARGSESGRKGAGGLNAHARVVASVTQPPVPADSEESTVDRRPFLTSALIDTNVPGPKVPDFRGMTLRRVLEESAARGLQIELEGAQGIGLARDQQPPAGTILPPGARVRVQFAR